jgi:hypothetical protein
MMNSSPEKRRVCVFLICGVKELRGLSELQLLRIYKEGEEKRQQKRAKAEV